MAYATPVNGHTFPIPPNTPLFPAAQETPRLNINCPGGVCRTDYHDKIFRYTPDKSIFTWHFLLTYTPLVFLVILLLVLIAWISSHYNKSYREYEENLQQRLLSAMEEGETEVDV